MSLLEKATRLGRGLSALALVIIVALGCSSERQEVGPGIGVITRDSAGVRIIETPGRAARRELAWAVGGKATLRLGCLAGPSAYLFRKIAGVARQPNGSIVAVDEGSGEIRFFGRQGELLRSVGGKGQGPGEFILPAMVGTASDSILVYDRRLARLTMLDAGGELVWTKQLMASVRGSPFGVLDGHLATFWAPIVVTGRPGVFTEPAEFWILDLSSSRNTQLGSVPGRRSFRSDDPIPRVSPLPFDVLPSAAVGDNMVFLTPGEDPEVRAYDSSGQLRRIQRIAEPTHAVSEADLRAYVDHKAEGAGDPVPVRARYSEMPYGSVMPAFRSLVVDDVGWLWAETFHIDEEVHNWVVFDTAGVARGLVRTPRGLKVRQIGSDFVLGVQRDQYGVERVALFSLTRNAPWPPQGDTVAQEGGQGMDPCVERSG